jgi:hypothetical protein
VEFVYRFLIGGFIVSVFALVADVLRPRGFAGLFGAAPSVALATLALTLLAHGKAYAALEARSMLLGAVAFFIYTAACTYLMARRHVRAATASIGLLALWILTALGLCSALLRSGLW